ncbi:MAG: 4-(cytidine 5'-diphospho)-2-C-methyl-D-erythritol kinase [Fimbriimonadaceae bacterium]
MLVRCPAKVNTFLSVGAREESGYHPLRSVMQAVGLFDDLSLTVSEVDEIVCDCPDLPRENTMTKALRLLRELARVPPLRIELTKRIPAQSGLGGGSSDAAGVIRAARAMLPDEVSAQFAHEVASAVGSDVPFFLVGGRARVTGYGEIVEPLPDVPETWLLIVRPAEAVSTVEAYARLDESPREWREFSDEHYNDFERVAPCASLELSERLQTHGASGALLCGSGSAVFGTFPNEQDANTAKEKLSNEGFGQSYVARTLTREESLWTS